MAENEGTGGESKAWLPEPEIQARLARAGEIGVQLREVDVNNVIALDGSVTDEEAARKAVHLWLLERGYSALVREMYGRDFEADPPSSRLLKIYHYALTDSEIL